MVQSPVCEKNTAAHNHPCSSFTARETIAISVVSRDQGEVIAKKGPGTSNESAGDIVDFRMGSFYFIKRHNNTSVTLFSYRRRP